MTSQLYIRCVTSSGGRRKKKRGGGELYCYCTLDKQTDKVMQCLSIMVSGNSKVLCLCISIGLSLTFQKLYSLTHQ